MDFMELREFKAKQIENAYDRALKKQLIKFLEIEDQALDLLADSMVLYSTASRNEMDDYLAKTREFNAKLEEVEEVQKIINCLEAHKGTLFEQMRNSLDDYYYGSIASGYCDELAKLREKRKENK